MYLFKFARQPWMLLLPALLTVQPAVAETLHPFKPGSLGEIQAERAGKPFLLMFWSIDCASCMKELHGIAAAISKHPDLDIVMVSTDEEAYANDVESVLDKHGLRKVESWIFSDSNAQRLRYEIDPAWFGELPRSYSYDAAHKRQGNSGVLPEEQIEAWWASVRPHS